MALVTVACPICSAQFSVAATLAGQTISCPECQRPIRLPDTLQLPLPVETTGPIVSPSSATGEDANDEAELYAPGFEPMAHSGESESSETDLPAVEKRPPKLTEPPRIVDRPIDPPNIVDRPADRSPQTDHALLPPRYPSNIANPKDQEESETAPTWADEDRVFLPTDDGGVRVIDRRRVHIQTDRGRIPLVVIPDEQKALRRKIRGWIVYGLCLVFLIIVFVFLVRASGS